MKKLYTFAALLIAGVTSLSGGVQVFAQSIQNTSNGSPYVNNENCSITNSGGSSSDTTNTNENIIPIGGTISYQGSNSTTINTDTTIYPNITYKPSGFTTDNTISAQDTISFTELSNTSTYTTKIYAPSNISYDNTVNYQDSVNLSVNNSNTSPKILPINTSDSCNETAITNLPTPYANLTVNDTGIAYVSYDGSATLKWDSVGMDSCTVDPTAQSGTSGQYELQNITSNTTVTLNCDVSSEYANFTISPSSVQIKVLPPTFDYLKAYLSLIQPSSTKKVNLTSVSNFIDQAQKAKKIDLVQSFLQKSVDNLKQTTKGNISSAQITKYENAVNYLSKSLPVKVVIATDGCSVTATGTPGLILQYGANENMRRGYGDEATIPASGTIIATIYAPNGWQSTAEVVDSTGLIYARDTKDVTTDSCPTPPVVYDPVMYNGYPEKWAVPEVGTVIDDWGYYNKTAESYVAFRVTNSGKTFPVGYGSASDWLAKATTDGYIVDYPQAGDIAINTLGISFGGPIAWYVDSVDASGNYQTSAIRSDGNMNWSRGTVSDSSYLKYIRIP